ncbi:Importin-5 like [Actinidia chinensis var. chinensis]|uniref:Importin-5 like n=1 Tax=Actinidia chinensis var. chinensis TaxID=1590841 RepID=A0A2R6Q0P1_ACTCC|nr:Importin-5 like [Actinidia chinensis var. chinensis]
MASSSSPSADTQRVGDILLSMDPTPFITVLSNLSSSDNALRSGAETDYDFMKKDYPNGLCLRLAHLIASSPKPTTRCLSATLLLRLLRRDGPHLSTHLTAICLKDLKSILLHHLYYETDIDTFNNLCSIISSLAIDLLPRNQWPELNLFFFQSLDSDASAQSQLAVFLIFAEAVPETGEILSIHEEGLLKACAKYMRSNMEDSRIRVAAVRASVGWIVYLKDEFTELVVLMVTTLFDLLNKNEEDHAQKVLEEMIVLAGAKTGFLKTLIDDLVESMLLVTEVKGAEDKTRELAIEFVLTVAEDRNQGCGMIEKLNKRITRLLGILIKMLVFIEDDLSWHKAGSDENNAGESDVFLYGMESLGRLASALRGNAIVPNHPDFLPEFWADKDWRKRHAAVTALRLISEGTSKVLQEHLERTVEKLLLLSRDPHPRVRWAVMSAIGQLSKDLAPQLQQQFHQKLVPALVAAMDDSQNPRVQVFAIFDLILWI